jgi:capsular polysaccharide biosynthesis protein
MDDIVVAVRKLYNSVAWEISMDGSSIHECAVLYNGFRLLFAAHGAGLANILYMQPGGVVCEIQADRAHALYIDMRKSLGLHHIVTQFPQISHYGKGMSIPVETAVKMIQEAMRCLGCEK